jgi:hypothetical protein
MTRLLSLIILSVAAGVGMRNAFQKTAPSTPQNISASSDVAKELREISGTPQPDKLWALDFAAFANSHSGEWIVARCKDPCLSESEAATQAHSDAARLVWPIVLARFSAVPSDAQWVRSRVEADVTGGRLDADKLVEKFDRPYGAVWTEAVLVDVSPSRIDSLLDSYKSQRVKTQHHQTQLHEVLLIGIAGAWLAYLLLNTITKGYFTLRLRFAAALVTVISVALLAQ